MAALVATPQTKPTARFHLIGAKDSPPLFDRLLAGPVSIQLARIIGLAMGAALVTLSGFG